MTTPTRPLRSLLVLVIALVVAVTCARLLGARSTDGSSAEQEAKERAAGFVNHLQVVNMLDVPVMVSVTDVDPAQWGRIPPDDEPPAGLQAEHIEPFRVGADHGLRPLRIQDGGGRATFTLDVLLDDTMHTRPRIGHVETASNSLEYCAASGKCFDGYGWFDWADATQPELTTFRTCIDDQRIIGTIEDRSGVVRNVFGVFQCDAVKFQTSLVLHY